MKKLLIIFLLVAGVSLGIYLSDVPALEAVSLVGTKSEVTKRWEKRIRDIGGADAYGELSEAVKPLARGAQHTNAHLFGAALFLAEGVSGLPVCDARFSFGCFHEFLGSAIAALGVESAKELNSACFESLVSSPLSCQHGIGHGVLAFLGYDNSSLLKALAVCKELGTDTIGGCYGGVFMEYNVRTMLGEDAVPRSRTEVLSPCDSLPSPYRPACAYWQPQWWNQAFFDGKARVEAFEEMGDYCRKLQSDKTMYRACFEGLGNIIPFHAGYVPKEAAHFCDGSAQKEVERLLCRSTAANIFRADVGEKEAEMMCEGFEGEYRAFCVGYAHNQNHVFNARELPL